jgi:DNA-binding NtrC family response regulator
LTIVERRTAVRDAPSSPARSVLYLGSAAAERAEIECPLAAANLTVNWVESVPHLLVELARHDAPVLLDLTRGAAALQAVREIRAHSPSCLTFAVVDSRRPDLTTEAVLSGVADVFVRPLAARRVLNAIDRELQQDGRKAVPSRDLYGQSPAMRDVLALIARATAMRAGVMIAGEDGTGREAVARAIHAGRGGTVGEFVTADCAAADAAGLEELLFGASGESRGLQKVSRDSLVFKAKNGTLFLRHISETPTRIQARLARVLRDREAAVVETGATVDLDLRPMAAVDAGFERLVGDGLVREDLFKRLSAIRVEMPPLRQRREDIPALANLFLREICAQARVPPKTLSRAALALVAALPWRGNAPELRVLLDNIVSSIQSGRNIGLDDVLGNVRLDGGSVVYQNDGTLKQARATFERDYIASILEQHHGRISDAARALGLQRTNLYRKMRSLHMKRSTYERRS